MVTTLAPCWYCSGLVRQFGIPKVVVGESVNFSGGIDWLRQCGAEIVDLDSRECVQLLAGFIAAHPGALAREHRRTMRRAGACRRRHPLGDLAAAARRGAGLRTAPALARAMEPPAEEYVRVRRHFARRRPPMGAGARGEVLAMGARAAYATWA
jgi:hypothetical protein